MHRSADSKTEVFVSQIPRVLAITIVRACPTRRGATVTRAISRPQPEVTAEQKQVRVSDTEMPPRCPFRRLGSSNRSQTKFCRDSSRAPSAVRTLASPAAGAAKGQSQNHIGLLTPAYIYAVEAPLTIRQQREHQRRRSQPRRAGEPLCCRGKTRNGGSAR